MDPITIAGIAAAASAFTAVITRVSERLARKQREKLQVTVNGQRLELTTLDQPALEKALLRLKALEVQEQTTEKTPPTAVTGA